MPPIAMLFEDTLTKIVEEVLVYDFFHTSMTDSYALCWNPRLQYWVTAPVHMLKPIIRKELNE